MRVLLSYGRESAAAVATGPSSDSSTLADWVGSSSSPAVGDLSLGFDAGRMAASDGADTSSSSGGMWASGAAGHIYNSGIPPDLHFWSPASPLHRYEAAGGGGATVTLNSASPVAGVGSRLSQPTIGGAVAANKHMLNNTRNHGGGGMQLWQRNQQGQDSTGEMKKSSNNLVYPNLSQSGSGGAGNMEAVTCQDCGNQAKKDCSYRRCRSCCKSRGYDCSTHVKSTWVPAARRRERKLAVSSHSSSGAEKRKLASQTATTSSPITTSNTSPPRSLNTSTNSIHQDAGLKDSLPLPRQLQAPADFKCVRVTAVVDGEDEYAYEAVVRIGGHVFKGFLYDQGVEDREFPDIS